MPFLCELKFYRNIKGDRTHGTGKQKRDYYGWKERRGKRQKTIRAGSTKANLDEDVM